MHSERVFISVYFGDAKEFGRNRGDVTVAFDPNDELYHKVRSMGSQEIKNITGLHSYKDLLESAKKEHRPLSNILRYRLRINLYNE